MDDKKLQELEHGEYEVSETLRIDEHGKILNPGALRRIYPDRKPPKPDEEGGTPGGGDKPKDDD